MKTTESVLRMKSLISWAYLLIAIGLIAITIFPTFYTGELCIIHTDYIGTGNGNGYAEKSPGIPGLFLLVLAIIYIVHFVYGAFYYPNKYREILREKYVEDSNDCGSYDYSFLRGSVASSAVCLVMYLNIYDIFIKYQSSYLFWGILFIWLLLNFVLLYSTSTGDLFDRASVVVNKTVLTPWKQSETEDSHDYETISFDYPVSESKEEWEVLVATAYAVSLKNEYNEEKLQEAEAEKLSQKIMQDQ